MEKGFIIIHSSFRNLEAAKGLWRPDKLTYLSRIFKDYTYPFLFLALEEMLPGVLQSTSMVLPFSSVSMQDFVMKSSNKGVIFCRNPFSFLSTGSLPVLAAISDVLGTRNQAQKMVEHKLCKVFLHFPQSFDLT